MGRGIFVTGTDTAVGKTFVTAALIRCLRQRGRSIGVMKPVETGCADDSFEQSDAGRLRAAAASEDEMGLICPYRFPFPTAPLAAARRVGRAIDPAELRRCYGILAARHEMTFVEGAGGLLVPITERWDVRNLIADLDLPVIVVGSAALGGINQARLTLEALHAGQRPVLAVVLNQPRPITSALEWEQSRVTVDVVRELVAEPVLGILPYVEEVRQSWQHGVETLASDTVISRLADLVDQAAASHAQS